VKTVHGAINREGQLFRKYVVFIMSLVCGVLLVSGGIGIAASYQENKLAVWRLQQEKAMSASTRIELFIRQIEQQLAFAALPQLGTPGSDQRRIEFFKLLRQAPAITDVAQLDADGREQLLVSRLSMDISGSGRDRSHDPAYLLARPGQTYFSPVHFRKETEPYMTVALRSGGNVIVAEVNLKFIWEVVSRIKIGEKGKAYVVDANGYLIADPDIGLVLKKMNLAHLGYIRAALDARDEQSARLVKDSAGHDILSAFAPVEPTGWKVFVEQPAAEVYATLDAAIARTGALLLASLALSIVASLLFARRLARPIAVLQHGARRIGEGDLEQRIDIRTGDELETLAEQFNAMSRRLRESYAGLEREVEVRTAELSQSLAQQTAISEILQAIASSPTDMQPVLGAIVECAGQSCNAASASIYLMDGDMLRHVASKGWQPGMTPRLEALPLNTGSISGCALLERRTIHLHDVVAESDAFPVSFEFAQQFGHRTVLATPLLRDNAAFGTILLQRMEVAPFSEEEVGLLKTFANQAVIALGNVRLFDEIQFKSQQLQTAYDELKHTLSALKQAQTQLVQSEKMAALGGLVAGVAHEINTPVGVGVTAASTLQVSAARLGTLYQQGKMMKADLEDFLEVSEQSSQMILTNLERASNLIHSFKQVAVDQTSEAARRFNVKAYIEEILMSLGPQLKKTSLRYALECADDIVIDSYPGALSQIVTNLLMNAVMHAYAPGQDGTMTLEVALHASRLQLRFCDDGNGIASDIVPRIFDPFFTTRRGQGGSGLGLNIVYNLVTQTLKGTIVCTSEVGKGTCFAIHIPVTRIDALH
jgi:signal transduction histidine kinase